jgi:hypothetical protein
MYHCSRSTERSRTPGIVRMFRFRSTQASWALLTKVGELCAVVWLSFGITLAVILDTPFDKKMQSLLLLGLLPAVGCYAGGRVLFYLGMIGRERRREYIVRSVGRAFGYVSRTLAILAVLGQKAYDVALLFYPHVRRSIFQFSCLLIRTAAQLLLKIQSQVGVGGHASREAPGAAEGRRHIKIP